MIIKKFRANTEEEAIKLARDELGGKAFVIDSHVIRAKGIKKLFVKPVYEISAAVDDSPLKPEMSRKEQMKAKLKERKDIIFDEEEPAENERVAKSRQVSDTAAIELQLNNLTNMIEKQIGEGKKDDEAEMQGPEADKNMACIKVIYNQLVENEVDEKYINQIISEIEPTLKKDTSLENILSNIYQKIVLKLGKTEVLDITPGKVKYVFFIGPTGVGKTTTIAKLASALKIDKKMNVALLTSDTYRIAAVEQLHTYANILNIPLSIADTESEILEAKETLSSYDVVLIDTAGRSHRDRDQRDNAERLINSIPAEQREVFLVLSVTTKYKDLIRIADTYSEFSDYKLIFTKLDETDCLGNIFNIKMHTKAPLSYATFGQGVPNDIGKMDPQKIAKQLLGGMNRH